MKNALKPFPNNLVPSDTENSSDVDHLKSERSSIKSFPNNLVPSDHLSSTMSDHLKPQKSSLQIFTATNPYPLEIRSSDQLKRRRSSALEGNTSSLKTFSTNRPASSDIEDMHAAPDHLKCRRSSVMDGNLRRASRIIDRFEQQELAKEIQQQLSIKQKMAANKSVYDELRHCRYLRLRDEYKTSPASCPCNKCEKKN